MSRSGARARKAVGMLMVAATAVSLATGCTKRENSTDTTSGVKLVTAGTLTLCTINPAPPFEFKDSTGKIVGFDIDLFELVAKRLKLKTAVIDTPFQGIKTGQNLKTSKCDLAAAGITILPERRQVMDFSVPYFDNRLAVLTKSGQSYASLASLRGKRLGVMSTTTGQEYAQKHAQENGYTTVDYKDVVAIPQALESGQIQAGLHDVAVWTDYVKKHPGFQVTTSFNTGEQYGIAVTKGINPKLLAAVNTTITTAKGDGTYAKIYRKWIGTDPPR